MSLRLPILLTLVLSGCGGYASTSEEFRKSLTRGQPNLALDKVNDALDVDRKEQVPKPDTDTPLLLLERASILQALGFYELSAKDFQRADKALDVLDLTNDTAGQIGKYLFSDDATTYKSPPHEKLLLSTLNMVNYLALGQDSGAKVEARRFTINRKYLEDADPKARNMLALGSYLAGFAFEQAREPEQAIRHYADSLDAGGVPTLRDAIRRLHADTGVTDPRVAELLGGGDARTCTKTEADLAVVVQTGMAPFRVAKRLPIGAAVVIATAPGPGARLSPAQQRRANVFAAKGLLKWVNYPSLKKVRNPAPRLDVSVDGQRLPDGVALNVERRVVEQYERVKGSIIASSITRLITRAVAGEGTQAATRKASGSGIAGLLVGLAVEGALTAADTPDTRGWVTLPARFHLARGCVPAGTRRVSLRYRGRVMEDEIELRRGGWGLVNFSALR